MGTKRGEEMGLEFRKIKKNPTITEAIIEQIKEKIVRGELKPGQQLPSERILAESFSVGRSSVREAIRALQYMGILEVRSGEGTFLTENLSILSDRFKTSYIVQRYSLIELIEARKIIEGETVYLATKRSNEEEKESLREVFEEAIKAEEDVEVFLEADFAFHKKIAEMSNNSVLEEFFTAIRELTLKENLEVIKKEGQIQRAIAFHREILNCILIGNPELAKKKMLEHLSDIELAVKELIARQIRQEGQGR
ncbi:MAG: GntR family transcriptional regulator, transcriptional repressor for pyruvate dehydrogenase complex [Caldanaerobacter sp.]|nr:GntR family transcriptional regulator, transcriptional repressor for pyruvate dehydrogenase complex [Caldanaerobacter sp.]